MLTNRLEHAITAMTAMLITAAVSIWVVTAKAEQIPSTCKAIGLLLNRGSVSTFLVFTGINHPSFPVEADSDTVQIRRHQAKTGADSLLRG